MDIFAQMIITVFCSAMASSGLWLYIQKKADAKDCKASMLIGLGHDRITSLGMTYIERGWITQDEYENLNDYLYKPYQKLGGNGSAERIMQEVRKLEIRRTFYNVKEEQNV